MKTIAFLCSFLFFIFATNSMANSIVDVNDNGQIISETVDGIADIQMVDLHSVSALQEGLTAVESNTVNQVQALNALNVNANTDYNKLELKITNANNQNRIFALIESTDYSSMNKFTRIENVNNSLNGNYRAECEMQMRIGLESINQFETVNNSISSDAIQDYIATDTGRVEINLI